MQESGIFVVALTPNAVRSDWVKQETAYALSHQKQMQVFPLLVQACEVEQLSGLLTTLQFVDFERGYDEGLAKLCRALGLASYGSERSKPYVPVPQPTRPSAATWGKLQQRVDSALTDQKWEEAERLIKHWLELDPDDPTALAARTLLHELKHAAELSRNQRQLDEALANENWKEAARYAAILLQLEPRQPRAERALNLAQSKLQVLHTTILTLAKGVTLEMIRIPAGVFLFGENKQKLKLAEYWISKTTVTVAQYWAFLQTTKHLRGSYWEWKEIKRKPYLDHPAVDVNWADANSFCAWASQVTGSAIRLPSEQEWEKAARGQMGMNSHGD
ncbi:MAG: SUMF1/EgtB/PvdO family nonheme iron enzyme [Anaerolineae bacterium]|nr:SUMF1/EgtB/PvdO family nonheme iron enzyme [Anaerolineae bacterium]